MAVRLVVIELRLMNILLDSVEPEKGDANGERRIAAAEPQSVKRKKRLWKWSSLLVNLASVVPAADDSMSLSLVLPSQSVLPLPRSLLAENSLSKYHEPKANLLDKLLLFDYSLLAELHSRERLP